MMLNAAAVAKQLAAGSDPKAHDRTLAALMRLSSYLTLSGHALPTLLWPELERLLLDGDDLPPRHRILVYAIARASGGSSVGPNSASGRCGLMERPSVLNATAKDLTDPTVNDSGVLAASTAALAALPSAALLRFFARPTVDASGDPEAGVYACEAGAEALGRVLSHPDVCVITACVPSVARAVVRAFGLVHCPAVLRDAAAHRGHESQAATLRFGEVVRDRVAEVFARLVDLTLGVGSSSVDGSDERVIFAAATALHQCITTAAARGGAGFPGWSWARDARLLAKQQALVLGHSADTSAAAATTVVAGDENSFVGNGSGSSGAPGLSPRAGRDLHALLMVQLLGKPLKKEALLRVVSHHASGGLAHPALLKLGTDLLLAALREAPPSPPPSHAARSTRNQSQASEQQHQQQREHQQRAAAAALRAWAEGALSTACASSVSEEQSAGCAQLSRVLHEPHPFLWAGSQGPAKRAHLFGLVVDSCLGLAVRAPWDSSSGGSGSSEHHRTSGGDDVRSRASSTSQSMRRRGNSITSSSSSSAGATSAAAANAAAHASSERCYKPALHHHWPAPNLNSCDAAWVALALTCLPGCAVAIPVPASSANAAAATGKGGSHHQASRSMERALLPARAAQLVRLALLAPKVATRLAMLGACCRVLVADPSVLPQSYSSSGGKTSSECDEDVGPSPAACVATFLAHPWVEATLSNRRFAHKTTASGVPFGPLPTPHSASRRSTATPNNGNSHTAGAAAAATAAVAVGLANATAWPEGDHCRHELAVALLSAVSHQWSQCMVASELAFQRDARALEEDQAQEAAKYGIANSNDSDGEDGNNGLWRGASRSKKGAAANMVTLDTTEDDAQEERLALLARIAARSAALRWSECAAVLLGCQDLATAASSNGGTAGSSGGSKSRGRRLVECLSWPCSDEPLFGAAGDLNSNLFVGGGVGSSSGFGGGSSGGGAANQHFPSGAAPSAWVRLLALSLRCVHGGCGALRHEETILVQGDEAARSAGGQRTSDWVQKRTKAATAAAATHADLNAIDETIEALREKVAALHDLGEAEMATSLSTTVAKECAKRHRKAALMVLPRAQERRRWCEVTHGLCKLIGDVVVWQFGRGLPDRSTRVQLLCLLVDAWPALCSSHKRLKALAHHAASEHAHFHHDMMHGHSHNSGSGGVGLAPVSPDRGGLLTPPPPLRPAAQSSDSLGSAGSNSGGMLRRAHSAPIDSTTPPPPAPPPAPFESPGMLRAAGFTGRRSHSMSNGSDFDDRSMTGSDFGSMSRVEYEHDDVDARSMAGSDDLDDGENASMGGGDDDDDDVSWSFGGSVGWGGGGGGGMGDAVAQDLARELTRELIKPTLSPAAVAASVSPPAVKSSSPTKPGVASASSHNGAASSSLRSGSLSRDHGNSSQNNGGGDNGGDGSGDDDSGDEGNSHQGSLSGVGSGTIGSGLSGNLAPHAGAAAATGVNSSSKLNAVTSGGRGAWVGLLGGGTNARPYAPSATHEATAVLMLHAAVRLALRCPSAAAAEVTTAIEDLLSSMDRNACLQTTLPPAAMTTVLFTREEAVVSSPSPALMSGSRRGSTALAAGFGSGWGCGPSGDPGGEAGTFRGCLLHARAVLSAAALFANNNNSMNDGFNRVNNGNRGSNARSGGHQPSSAGFVSPPPGGISPSSADPSDPFALRPENVDPFRTPVANNHPSPSTLARDAFAPRAEPDPFLADPNSNAAVGAAGEAPASNGFFGAANAFGVGFGAEKSKGSDRGSGGAGIGGIGNNHRGSSGSVDEGFFGGGFASPATEDAESAGTNGDDFFGEAPSSTSNDEAGVRTPQPKNGHHHHNHHHHHHPTSASLPGGPAVALSPPFSGDGLVVDAMGRSISAAHSHSSGAGGYNSGNSLTPLRAALLGEHLSTGAVPLGVTSSLNEDTHRNGTGTSNSGLYFLAAASAAGTAFAGCGLTGGYTDPGGSLGLSDGRGASYAPAGIFSTSTAAAAGAAALSRASPLLLLNVGSVSPSWGAVAAVPGVPVLADQSIVTASSSSLVAPRWNGLPAGSGSGASWGGTWAALGGASNINNLSNGDGSSSGGGHSHRAVVLGVGSTTLFAEGPASAPSALHYSRVAAGGLAAGLAGNSPLDNPLQYLSASSLDSAYDKDGLLKLNPSSADVAGSRSAVHWRQFATQIGGASDPLQGQLVVAVASGANEGNIGAASAAPPVVEVELTAHNATNCVLHGVGARLLSADAVPPPPPSVASGRSGFGNGNHSSGSSFASPISLSTTTGSLSSSSHQVQSLGGALEVVSGPQKAQGPIEGLPSGATIVWRWRIELPSLASLGGVASSPASLLAAGISDGGGSSSSANEKEDVVAWQRACVSVGAQLWFTSLDAEDPGDSSDSEDDEPPAVKAGADGRRARGQSGDGISGVNGGGRSRASSHNVDIDDDSDEEVADFGADAEADAKAKEESKGPKPPAPVPCLLPPARLLLPPTAFLHPGAASARTPAAFAALWSALPFARTVQAKLPIDQSAHLDGRRRVNLLLLGQSHRDARISLPADSAITATATSVTARNHANSSAAAAAYSSRASAASQLAYQWRGSATFAFLWHSAAASQWVAVVVSALRVVDPPLLLPQVKPRHPEQASQVPLSGGSSAEGTTKDEVSSPPHRSPSPPASTTLERPVPEVLGDVCFAAGVPDGLPPATAVTEAAKKAGPAYAAALRRRNAATATKGKPSGPPGLREQLHMLAHLYGIPTTTTVDAVAGEPTPPVVEANEDEEVNAASTTADSPIAADAADEQASAPGSPLSMSDAGRDTHSASHGQARKLPSSEWVFEVETRSGDAAFLASLFASYELPAAAAAAKSSRHAAPTSGHYNFASPLSRAVADFSTRNGFSNGRAAPAATGLPPPVCAGAHWLNFVGGLVLDAPGAPAGNNRSDQSIAAPVAAAPSDAPTKAALAAVGGSSETKKAPRLRTMSLGLHAPRGMSFQETAQGSESARPEKVKATGPSPEAATEMVLPAWRRLREERERLGLCRPVS